MRRNDCQPIVPTGLPMPGSKSPNFSGPLARQEQGTAPHGLGDLWEEATSHWENAWIDLGGEG